MASDTQECLLPTKSMEKSKLGEKGKAWQFGDGTGTSTVSTYAPEGSESIGLSSCQSLFMRDGTGSSSLGLSEFGAQRSDGSISMGPEFSGRRSDPIPEEREVEEEGAFMRSLGGPAATAAAAAAAANAAMPKKVAIKAPPPGLDCQAQEAKFQAATLSDALPSVGSAQHASGDCKPCAWFHKPKGCENGKECRHCHLCQDGEIKNRKKVKLVAIRKNKDEEEEQPQKIDLHPEIGKSALPDDATIAPPPGLKPMLSQGSELHGTGECKPCAWFHKPQGCTRGAECGCCHLCPEGELKARKKAKIATIRSQASQGELSQNSETSPQTSPESKPQSTPKVESTTPIDPDSLPSQGSDQHAAGTCRPCAWFHKPQGCQNGKECRHCHLCPDGEIKARKKSKNKTDDGEVEEVNPAVWSKGSELHAAAACRPCAWFHKPKGCENGAECRHCHICPEGEIKTRRKFKVAFIRHGELQLQAMQHGLEMMQALSLCDAEEDPCMIDDPSMLGDPSMRGISPMSNMFAPMTPMNPFGMPITPMAPGLPLLPPMTPMAPMRLDTPMSPGAPKERKRGKESAMRKGKQENATIPKSLDTVLQ